MEGHEPFHNGEPKHPEPNSKQPKQQAKELQLPISCQPPGPANPAKQLVWIIFGATGHMGRSLVKKALSSNDLVVAVGRTHENTLTYMTNLHPSPNYHGLLCDVRLRSTIEHVITSTLLHFTRIDIIANCSGYGVIGACEDQDEFEIRNQFDTNFMGTVHIVQSSLPYFREQGWGRYLIFSSTSGALGVPGLGPYCATKYAVEGLIEALLYEIDSFGIKATLVEPGLVRRDELDWDLAVGVGAGEGGNGNGAGTGTNQQQQQSKLQPLPTWGHFLIKQASAPYDSPGSPALHAKRMVQWLGDRQPTSAIKCAELVWQLAHCSFPPLRLLLGSYAIESIRDRLRSVLEELEDWKHLNFPASGDVLVDMQASEEGEVGGSGSQGKKEGS